MLNHPILQKIVHFCAVLYISQIFKFFAMQFLHTSFKLIPSFLDDAILNETSSTETSIRLLYM
jgi:hypothetical protein